MCRKPRSQPPKLPLKRIGNRQKLWRNPSGLFAVLIGYRFRAARAFANSKLRLISSRGLLTMAQY